MRLQTAIRDPWLMQWNAIPISMIFLLIMEMNGAYVLDGTYLWLPFLIASVVFFTPYGFETPREIRWRRRSGRYGAKPCRISMVLIIAF